MKKSVSLFFAAAFSLLLFSSCEESFRSSYGYGIGGYEPVSDTESLEIIKSYLAEVGCFTGSMVYESEIVSENDQKAVIYFDVNVDRINENELASRLRHRNVKFSYVVAEGDIIDPSGNNYLKSVTFKFGSYADTPAE